MFLLFDILTVILGIIIVISYIALYFSKQISAKSKDTIRNALLMPQGVLTGVICGQIRSYIEMDGLTYPTLVLMLLFILLLILTIASILMTYRKLQKAKLGIEENKKGLWLPFGKKKQEKEKTVSEEVSVSSEETIENKAEITEINSENSDVIESSENTENNGSEAETITDGEPQIKEPEIEENPEIISEDKETAIMAGNPEKDESALRAEELVDKMLNQEKSGNSDNSDSENNMEKVEITENSDKESDNSAVASDIKDESALRAEELVDKMLAEEKSEETEKSDDSAVVSEVKHESVLRAEELADKMLAEEKSEEAEKSDTPASVSEIKDESALRAEELVDKMMAEEKSEEAENNSEETDDSKNQRKRKRRSRRKKNTNTEEKENT